MLLGPFTTLRLGLSSQSKLKKLPPFSLFESVMIGQWKNECFTLSVLYMARIQFSAVTEYFKGIFPGWSHALCQFVLSQHGRKMAQSPLTGTTGGHRRGRPKSNHGQTMAEGKKRCKSMMIGWDKEYHQWLVIGAFRLGFFATEIRSRNLLNCSRARPKAREQNSATERRC